MVVLNQNRISPPPSHRSASILRQTPPQNNSKSPTPIRLFLRARYYDPHTAEFTSPDPLEYVDGMSLFRGYFVLLGPDPLGTENMDIYCRRKCKGLHPDNWPNNTKDNRTRLELKDAYDRCYFQCKDNPEIRAREQLLEKLKFACDQCLCDPTCDPVTCLADAEKISKAIYHTLRKNWRWTFPKSIWTTDHRHKGYYCWEWAYGLEDTVNNLKSSCFKARYTGASKDQDANVVHAWIEITSTCTGKTAVFIDDSWSNKEETFIHSQEPNCGFPFDYNCEHRSKCTPVPSYDDMGNPVR